MILLRSSGKSDKTIIIAIAIASAMLLMFGTYLWGQERRAPKDIEEGFSCLAKGCHDTLSAGPTIHRPVAKKSCEVCHEQDEETVHEFVYPDTGAELCYGCHDSMTKKKFVHVPLKDTKRPCLSCHDPHSTQTKHLIKAKTVSLKCLQCHTDLAEGPRFHKSRAVKGCTGCHVPHASDSPKFLKSQPPKLCYSCHEDIQEDLTDAQVVHGPLSVGCTPCHDVHRPLAGKGLKKSGADLCMGCHANFKNKFSSMSERHSKLRDKKDCLRCHLPHVSSRKSLLANTDQKLCLTCHKDNIQSPRGRLIKGLSAQMVKNAHLHGPLSSQKCTPCHEPHGNDQFNFVRKAYPSMFYSPYETKSYALCFSCHDSSLADTSQTTSATKFRDGSVNLHYVHVNKVKKGRTCRTCHSPHASKNPHMLADSVPFGKWKLPIGFREEKDGGTCASGCHLTKTYNRLKIETDNIMPESKTTTRPTEFPKTTTSPTRNVSSDAR